jgi:hypothetical protein
MCDQPSQTMGIWNGGLNRLRRTIGCGLYTVLGCGLVLDLLEFAASSLCTRILRSPWNQTWEPLEPWAGLPVLLGAFRFARIGG